MKLPPFRRVEFTAGVKLPVKVDCAGRVLTEFSGSHEGPTGRRRREAKARALTLGSFSADRGAARSPL